MGNSLIIFLRTVHIFAGVLWVGSAVFYLFFVEPVVKSLGPAGPKFMQGLIERRRYPIYMSVVSLLTVVAGALLYWFTSAGLQIGWITSGPGIGFTIGSVVSVVVFFMGIFMLGPRAQRMSAIGKEIAASGGPPNPDQTAQLQKLNRELDRIERLDFYMLTIALVTMATARYWPF